jgi:cell wall arabinan synthesis protein/EmbC-like arabinotransferase in arabinogalactan biosynthesis/arabinosyltransferase-like concanavalin domain-containing protein
MRTRGATVPGPAARGLPEDAPADGRAPEPQDPRRGSGRRLGLGLVSGLLALIAAVLLPVAPVLVNDPVVSWPVDPAAPQSTSLELTRYVPRSLDVSFSCSAVQRSAAGAQPVVLASIRPGDPAAATQGLLIAASADRLTVDVAGTRLVDEAVPTGSCVYRLTGDMAGVRLDRDGEQLGPVAAAPQVDALITDLTAASGLGTGDLSVRMRVDDPFASSPSALKTGLMVLLVAGVLVALGCLWREDAAARRGHPARDRARPSRRPGLAVLVDVVVLATMCWWVFVGPTTVDDGYYSAMAKNVPFEGYVANYYQLYNQSFAPFSWWYYFLAQWQHLAGTSLVVQRIPALGAGVAMWAAIRWYCGRRGLGQAPTTRLRAVVPVAVTGLAFLAWWLAFDLGVRPEPFGAAPLGAVLVAATVAVERGRLLPLGLALAVAALGFTAHPTGFVVLAPLIVLAPRLWSLVRGPNWGSTVSRLVTVAAPGALISLFAFADNGVYDFLRSQEIFTSVEVQTGWADEYVRYASLLGATDQGDFAKRVVVLLGLLCLVVLALLAADPANRRRFSARLWVAGGTLAVGLLLLWLTPSKWTQHFGSLAVAGPIVIGLTLTYVEPRVRELAGKRRLPVSVLLAVGGAVVVLCALSMRGPNIWAPAWNVALPHAVAPPYLVHGVTLGGIGLWALVTGVSVLVVWGWRRGRARRSGGTSGTPRGTRTQAVLSGLVGTVVILLLVDTAYLVGSFSFAAVRTLDSWSPGAANLTDPMADRCSAGGQIDVTDPRRATSLPPADPAAADTGTATGTGFVVGGGWPAAQAPPFAGDPSTRPTVWGSFATPADPVIGSGPEDAVGTVTSPWYALPGSAQDRTAVVVMAAGRLSDGNALVVEYAGSDGSVLDRVALDDGANSPAWRSFQPADGAQPAAATRMRLVGRDGSSGAGGWLAFAAPSVQPVVTLSTLTGRDSATAVNWLFASYFPCQRQPRQQYGINEPAVYGVLLGRSDLSGFTDDTFESARGALFGRVFRGSDVAQLVTSVGFGDIPTIQVYLFDRPYPADAYSLTVGRERASGLTGP